MRKAGCLIAFEGIEGGGKSTQIQRAAQMLRERGFKVVETREPGGTPLGVELRRLLMHRHDTPPTPLAELLLYLADRAQHIAEVIGPAMAAGEIVLSDRFSASTVAYQGYARGLDLDTVIHLDRLARRGVSPSMTLVFDCPVEIGLRRARGDDRFHREEQGFHERVRAAFLKFAADDPAHYRVIDATAPSDDVHRHVMQALTPCLEAQ